MESVWEKMCSLCKNILKICNKIRSKHCLISCTLVKSDLSVASKYRFFGSQSGKFLIDLMDLEVLV